MNHLACTLALTALATATASAAVAAGGPASNAASNSSDEASGAPPTLNEVVVTATRRSERLQDVPLSITAFSQEELTQKGIVGFEGIARETPGAVLNVASDNNFRLTARGISTNGYRAGLQTTTTIYLDELPLSTIGNTVTPNPNLYDVERVEFLRGPQGTLFGSGSLSGALRILTHSPDLAQLRCVRSGRFRIHAGWQRHPPALRRHGQHSAGHRHAGAARCRLLPQRGRLYRQSRHGRQELELADGCGRARDPAVEADRPAQRPAAWAPTRTAIPRTPR